MDRNLETTLPILGKFFQEGTYAPADDNSRFMGSAAMDAAGNIGLAFNIASATFTCGN